jgi:hypothetical protein
MIYRMVHKLKSFNQSVDPSDSSGIENFVVGEYAHYPAKYGLMSIITDEKYKVQICSDGLIEDSFRDPLTSNLLNCSDVKSIQFFPTRPDKVFFPILIAMVSFICSIYGIWQLGSIETNQSFLLLFTVFALFYCLTKLFQRNSTRDILRIQTENDDFLFYGGMRAIGIIRMSIILFSVFFIIWQVNYGIGIFEKSEELFAVSMTLILLSVIWGIPLYKTMVFFIDSLFPDQSSKNNLGSTDLQNLQRMVMLFNAKGNLSESIDEKILNLEGLKKELKDLKARLDAYEISFIKHHLDTLRETNSTTIGAIMVTTAAERLLRKIAGVENVKLSKKDTLFNLAQKLQKVTEFGSKIGLYLEEIRTTGNPAKHGLEEIEWKEYLIMLERFCEIVDWFGEKYPLSQF